MRATNLIYLTNLEIVLFTAALLFTATPALANDSDRISALEKDVQALKQRLQTFESSVLPKSTPQVVGADGWKNLANWRNLKRGMSYEEARVTLGEPHSVDGGNFTYWFYSNQGSVCFYKDRLDSWTEPR